MRPLHQNNRRKTHRGASLDTVLHRLPGTDRKRRRRAQDVGRLILASPLKAMRACSLHARPAQALRFANPHIPRRRRLPLIFAAATLRDTANSAIRPAVFTREGHSLTLWIHKPVTP